MNTWHRVCVIVPPAAADAVANYLVELGSPGVEWEDVGDTVELAGYFTPAGDVAQAVKTYLVAIGSADARVTSTRVPECNWAEAWREQFHPVQVGNFFIRPPWVAEVPAGRIAITIRPGMAFGTGHHESTRTCLALLERHLPPRCRALDFGAGSGVLAIAMCLLGAIQVVAVDSDARAREATRANAQRNGVAERIVVRGALAEASGPFDAIAANLDAETLRAHAAGLSSRARAGTLLVVAGLVRGQEPAVRSCLAGVWREVDAMGEGEWVSLALVRCP